MVQRALQKVPGSVSSIVRQMIAEGQIAVPQLQKVERAEETRERVYHRPNETVYETRTRTIEVFYFGDDT
jgi:hypothetical protein